MKRSRKVDMRALLPVLTFYLAVLVAIGVGAMALIVGNSPFWAALKAGAALLLCSAVGWVLNVMFLTAQVVESLRPMSEDFVKGDLPEDDVVVIDSESAEDSANDDQVLE